MCELAVKTDQSDQRRQVTICSIYFNTVLLFVFLSQTPPTADPPLLQVKRKANKMSQMKEAELGQDLDGKVRFPMMLHCRHCMAEWFLLSGTRKVDADLLSH